MVNSDCLDRLRRLEGATSPFQVNLERFGEIFENQGDFFGSAIFRYSSNCGLIIYSHMPGGTVAVASVQKNEEGVVLSPKPSTGYALADRVYVPEGFSRLKDLLQSD